MESSLHLEFHMEMGVEINRGIKSAPRRGSGGERTESANCAGGAGILILHHPAPPVKPLSARLRRRGLRHQMIWCALITALLGGEYEPGRD